MASDNQCRDSLGGIAIIEYKGYLASVEFDHSADILHGRVVNSGPYPIATFEATATHELRREFERSVDEYLRWCEEDGVDPRRPFPAKLLSVRRRTGPGQTR